MAGRIRTIKPEMLEDAMTAGLTDGAFRLFIGMILLADDTGRLPSAPNFLAGRVFWNAPRAFDERSAKPREVPPVDPERVASLVAELERARLIATYTVRGQRYAIFRNWAKHQRIDKPGPPKFPGPDEAEAATEPPDPTPRGFQERSTNAPGTLDEPSKNVPGGIGTEGKGTENPPTPQPRSRTVAKQPWADEPPPDPGTPARAAYDAILSESNLAQVTDRPAAFARELPASYPRIDLAAQIHRAAAWARDKRKQVRRGREFLRNWLNRAEPDLLAIVPAPAPPAPSPPKIHRPAGKPLRDMTPEERAEAVARVRAAAAAAKSGAA